MGRATRWLKGLLGMKKKEKKTDHGTPTTKKKQQRWSFAKSERGRDRDRDRDSIVSVPRIPVNFADDDESTSWMMKRYIGETEKDQNKHAIAVAAATAVAADAAVAAAQAAVAVVRLTSQGRGGMFSGGIERISAVKIQAAFRGFLARKALRALKGLVKLQAHVRGYLVRKQAAQTLHSMQALHRAQVAIRSQQARRRSMTNDSRLYSEYWNRKSMDKFDETRSGYSSKRLSACYEHSPYNVYEDSPKIVEIDTFKTRSRSRRSNPAPISDYAEDLFYTVPPRLSVPQCRNIHDHEWDSYYGEECRTFTAHSTPRFMNRPGTNGPVTPTKSVCGDTYFRADNGWRYPNYMADTRSFRAKLRSQSAPKQRPESMVPRRRIALQEIMEARNNINNVRMQRTCCHVQEPF
ncbi:hypothetical protein Droror1_Dr00006438 [Drosera rotundifolia]